jgi:hypothetical protein
MCGGLAEACEMELLSDVQSLLCVDIDEWLEY